MEKFPLGQVANSQGDQLSKKEELVQFTGTVIELLRGGMFRCKINDIEHEVIAQINGKMRMYKIKVLLGDTVDLEVSPYDLSKGRITRRL
jgi:translation initiation factor IF-1